MSGESSHHMGSNIQDKGVRGRDMLRDFKNDKHNSFELFDIYGHVLEFSLDQIGNQFIQSKFQTATIVEINTVFQELIPHALILSTDMYGKNVILKFFENGTALQKKELAEKLFGHVFILSLQVNGSRVIEKALDVVDMEENIRIVRELDDHIIFCVCNWNANYVIQKCIDCCPQEDVLIIVSACIDRIDYLAMHPVACHIIKKILKCCKDPIMISRMIDGIGQSVNILAHDEIGKYVVEYVVEHGKRRERSKLIEHVAGNIAEITRMRFSSEIISTCMTFGSLDDRQTIVNGIIGPTNENRPLQTIMLQQFGVEVIQKVLGKCVDEQLDLIVSRIKIHLNALKRNSIENYFAFSILVQAHEWKKVAAAEEALYSQ